MNKTPSLLGLALVMALAACTPPALDYTESEAPKNVTVQTASSVMELRFAPGSSRLARGDIERLRRAAASGAIIPQDRVTVAVAGAPALADARAAAVSAELLRYGIVPELAASPAIRSDLAAIAVDRSLVTMPPCPNWSKSPAIDFNNMVASNFGCSTAGNLAQMVANPMDLASGRRAGFADSPTAVSAVRRYYTDKVVLPNAVSVGPIAASPSSPVGGAGGGGGSGAPTSGSP